MEGIGEVEVSTKAVEHLALEHFDEAMKTYTNPHEEGAKLLQDIRRLYSRYKGNRSISRTR